MYEFSISAKEQRYALVIILLPLLVTIAFFALGAYRHVLPFTWVLFTISIIVFGLGITLGYHRLLSHRSFTPSRPLKIILVCLGCGVFQGPPFFWVGSHRYHHRFTDTNGDPHSPHTGTNKLSSFLHAHVGWMFNHNLSLWDFNNVHDLLEDRDLKLISKHYLAIALAGLFLPALINWMYYQTLMSFIQGLVLCGIIRVFLLQNITWGVNSFCHVFGRKDFQTTEHDQSRNSIIFGIIGMGDGWHNCHHAFPSSARHGLLWWQFDFSYLLLKLCHRLGWVKTLKVPSHKQIMAKRLVTATQKKMESV